MNTVKIGQTYKHAKLGRLRVRSITAGRGKVRRLAFLMDGFGGLDVSVATLERGRGWRLIQEDAPTFGDADAIKANRHFRYPRWVRNQIAAFVCERIEGCDGKAQFCHYNEINQVTWWRCAKCGLIWTANNLGECV